MRTSEYPYFQCDFDTFNPVQEVSIPFLTQDCNIIVSAPTASGKTAIAECVFGYVLEETKKPVCYVSPLKALLQEKYEKWKLVSEFCTRNLVVLSRDFISTKEDIDKAGMILATVESMNIRVRRGDEWIKKLGCIVIDEAHLIGTNERGSGLEAMLMGLTVINPTCRIVLLSGTLHNAKDVAQWVKSLNAKATKLVQSEWRPVKVRHFIKTYVTDKKMFDEVLRIITPTYPDDAFLVFVHSKRLGKELTLFLKHKGIVAAFYRADLQTKLRSKMETSFKDKQIPVMVTTSALSMGVNL